VTADRKFNRIRQVAPMCPPMREHWCHLANTIELVLPLAHQSLQPKPQIDRWAIFAQIMAESPYTLQWAPLSSKIALSHGDLNLTHDSFGPSEYTAQTASRSVQPFLHRWPQSVPILYNGTPLPPKSAPSHGGIWTPSNTWFPEPT